MNISVMAYNFQHELRAGRLNIHQVIRYIRQLGVTSIELNHSLISGMDPREVEKTLAETGTTLVCHDVFIEGLSADPAGRRATIARFHQDLQQAVALGARRVMAVPNPAAGDLGPPGRRWFIEVLQESLAEAARLGLTFTVENFGLRPKMLGTLDHLLELSDAVGPGINITCDIGSFWLNGEDPLRVLERLAPRIDHVHAKSWLVVPGPGEAADRICRGADGRYYTGAVLGEGVVDLRPPLLRLQQLGYQGSVAVEYEGALDQCYAARRGVTYLRSVLEALP